MTRADDKYSWAEHPSPCPQGDGLEEALPTKELGENPNPWSTVGWQRHCVWNPWLRMNSIAYRSKTEQWYHLWEFVVWTTVWLHFPSCKDDMQQSTLLLRLLCSLIPTHLWHPAWRSLLIRKFEGTEPQRSTLNTSRSIVPLSQGQKSVHKHFEWFWISRRESIQCKLTSALQKATGLYHILQRADACLQSRLCFIPLKPPGVFSLKCFCPLSAFAFIPLVLMVVLIQCSLFKCPSWSTGTDFYRATFWPEHWLAPYSDRW